MGTDEYARQGDLSQKLVQGIAAVTPRDRIDPDQHAVHPQHLFADFTGQILRIDRRFGVDAAPGEGREDYVQTARFRTCIQPSLAIAAPQQRYLESGYSSGGHTYAPARQAGRIDRSGS